MNPSDPRETPATPAAGSATEPNGAAAPTAPQAPGEARLPRDSAPVLSLEARKAERIRDREAARAARISAFIASDEERGEPRAESRLFQKASRPRGETQAPDPSEGARAYPTQPALGGVRPGEGLASGAVTVGPGRPAGTAVAGPGASRLAVAPRSEVLAPLVRPEDGPAARPGGKGGRAEAPPIRKPAKLARPRSRHWLVLLSFILAVILPTAGAGWYLWVRATPRFASYAGFSVRTEDSGSALELLGGMAALTGGSSSSDTDILYEFIRSQEIVGVIDDKLDLRELWSKGDPVRDPVFAFHAPGTIEDLLDYWNRMVAVYKDGNTGLINIEVQAFTPEDAQTIAQAIYDESTILINRLSDIAQEDATRYAEEDLETAVDRLKTARAALTRFRNETQIVDPASAAQSQMGLLSQLEGQLAQTLIDLDLLRQTAPDGDPRITQAEARVGVIEARMAAEREKFGLGTTGAAPADGGPAPGEAFADLLGQYESLAVDQEFASQAYTVALATYDGALAESRRQTRYLAAHVQPTLAERSDYPNRVTLLLLVFAFAALAWTIVTLGLYAVRDRR